MEGRKEEVHAPVSGVSGEARSQGGRRGLSTAHAVLQVLSFLEQHPDGVRAEEVTEFVGKSASTAYYLLASLVEEGFAVHEGGLYQRAPRRAAAGAAAPIATRSRTRSTTCSCAPTSAATSASSAAA